jgi:hypothetical protein
MANSTTIITDLQSAINNYPYSATAQANAQAAAGPIMGLRDNIILCKRKAEEMAEILAYLLCGSQIVNSYTAPTGGPITTGADNATFVKLQGVLNDLQ